MGETEQNWLNMVEFKLHYFPVFARGEPLRLMLSHAGADWENMIMTDFPAQKPNFPGGQLPCLELADGTKMSQSAAIGNYLGHKFGYIPTDPLKAYESDAIVQYLEDRYKGIIWPGYPRLMYKDEAELEVYREKVFTEEFPKLMKNLDKWLQGDAFLLGKKLSVCDFFVGSFYLAMCVNPMCRYGVADGKWAKILEQYPKFRAYGERFRAENKKWIDVRKEFSF